MCAGANTEGPGDVAVLPAAEASPEEDEAASLLEDSPDWSDDVALCFWAFGVCAFFVDCLPTPLGPAVSFDGSMAPMP